MNFVSFERGIFGPSICFECNILSLNAFRVFYSVKIINRIKREQYENVTVTG